MGVVAQVGRHRHHVELAAQVLRAVVDEDDAAPREGEMLGPHGASAGAGATLLGEVATDKAIDTELLCPGLGVLVAPGTPEDDATPAVREVLQDGACAGTERGAGEGIDEAAVHVENPAVNRGRCGRRRRRLWSGGTAATVGLCHYWYTLLAMKHPWDRRLGFWWIAEEHPTQPAVVASPSGITLTYAELAGRAHQIVHALRAGGLGTGDIFAYALPNGVDMLCWQLAANEGGFQPIALNPALSGAEIQRIVDHSGAAALVLHHDFADRVDQLSGTGSIRLRISVGGGITGFTGFEAFTAGQPSTEPPDRALGIPIVYSSGTTGQPKAVIRATTRTIDPSVAADAAKSFGHAFQFQPFSGVHLVSAGMHHGGCQGFYLGALNVGQALAILGKFDPEKTLAAIEEYRVTTAYMVPTQFVRMLRLPDEMKQKYDLSSLQVVVHSAAPCPLEVKRQMMEWWGPVIWETYGGMEGAATIAKPYRWMEKPGTVGRSVAGMSVMILDEDGTEVPRGETGHVYLEPEHGPSFAYRNDPELTASVSKGKAFTLGDMGYMDVDGYLFIHDRAKDMIISGGVNIYPAEVEGVLSSHAAVGDVAVIGVPDPEWGEQVKAVVEPVEGVVPDDGLAEELMAYCRGRMAHFKCPRSVDFRAQLPRTDGGKLYKRLLRDEYWAAAERNV